MYINPAGWGAIGGNCPL